VRICRDIFSASYNIGKLIVFCYWAILGSHRENLVALVAESCSCVRQAGSRSCVALSKNTVFLVSLMSHHFILLGLIFSIIFWPRKQMMTFLVKRTQFSSARYFLSLKGPNRSFSLVPCTQTIQNNAIVGRETKFRKRMKQQETYKLCTF
jgi:predicted membrane protein